MVIKINREIENGKFDAIENFAGKRVRSWKRCWDTMAVHILFEDGSFGELASGADITSIRFIQNHNFCVSCGEEHEAGYYDFSGRCFNTLKKIWESARKVFWHRYIKNGHKIP